MDPVRLGGSSTSRARTPLPRSRVALLDIVAYGGGDREARAPRTIAKPRSGVGRRPQGKSPLLIARIAVTLLALAAAGRGGAEPAPRPLPSPGSEAWEPTTFPRIARHTRYVRVREGALESLRAVSRCSASALLLPLEGREVPPGMALRWRWRVDHALDLENERVRSGDDFAARVYALFAFDPERASLARSIEHRLRSTLYGRDLPGQTLNYVWASRAPVGATWKSPYNDRTRVTVLRSGAAAAWQTETVDLAADHARLTGAPPSPPIAIGIMVDSDDSCGHAEARFADFEWVPLDDAEAR